MALSNELSSEIAEALLLRSNKSPRELKAMQEVIMRVHLALKQLNDAASRDERARDKSERSSAAGTS